MKLLTFLISTLYLKCAFLVSADEDVTEIILRLIVIRQTEENDSLTKLSLRYNQTNKEINKQLNQNVLPSVNEIYQGYEHHVEDLQNQAYSSGYDPSKCIENYKTAIASGAVSNVIDKAITEMKNVYEKINFDVYSNGKYNLGVISSEVDSITSSYVLCVSSEAPQYCNRTLSRLVLAKIEELPTLYSKEVEKTTITFTQLVVDYQNRIQDYLREAIAGAKPYIALLESCVSTILARS